VEQPLDGAGSEIVEFDQGLAESVAAPAVRENHGHRRG